MAEQLNISMSEDGKLPIFINIVDHTVENKGSFTRKKYELVRDKSRMINVFDVLNAQEDEENGVKYTSIETPDEYIYVKETPAQVQALIEEANKKFFGRF